ncbi:hypothetical protein RDI58_024175 [Solanum bulbocastanum]|uniref:Uncharacterized protein n=1 Tax=Solanum bulbocastanum TaxID=147425 RepID=A0AAN8T4E5_SOLBU
MLMDLQFEGVLDILPQLTLSRVQPSVASHLLQSLHLFFLVAFENFDPTVPLFPHFVVLLLY